MIVRLLGETTEEKAMVKESELLCFPVLMLALKHVKLQLE